ncbi:MAG: HlyC/CorC family transporter [Bdellovibrionales bacterium]|nr:HlyC/CorC family transporter [Bdellovibrionales bacterium]
MTLLVLFFTFAVLVSFTCSLLESVILSVNPSYVETQVKAGKKSGKVLAHLKEEIDRPLAAILTLNTIANTLGAAGVGAQVSKLYGSDAVAIASAVLTFTILIFSEIIPKTLGASNWKRFAAPAAYLIRSLIFILYPIVYLSEFISDLVGGGKKNMLTREEMIATAEIGVGHGALRKKESNIIRNLLMLDNIYVYDIMTPRSVLMALPEKMTVQEVIEKHKPIRYSRIPVYGEDLDHIEGVVHRYQILEASSNDQDTLPLSDLKTSLHSVPEDISVSACLDQLIHRNDHIFLVVDDYGSTMGIVTLEDAIETLLGVEIIDEFDSVADLRAYALEQWKSRKKSKTATGR